MVRVMFKNLKKSDFIEEFLSEKVQHILSKFPEATKGGSATAVVAMENSQLHRGADLFQVKLILLLKGMKPIILQKENGNIYQAVAVLCDRLLESLHRHFERRRDQYRHRRPSRWSRSGLAAESEAQPMIASDSPFDLQAVG